MLNTDVSIIIPFFNAEKWIVNSFQTILDQNFMSYEVIYINDGSTDESLTILKELIANVEFGSKFRVLTIENSGPGGARKAALDIAIGQWVLFLDVDDLLDPTAIRTLIHSSFDFDIVVGQSQEIKNGKKGILSNFSLCNTNAVNAFLNRQLPITLWPTLYKRNLFDCINLGEKFYTGEDFFINAQIYTRGKLRINVIPYIIHLYVKHDESITTSMSTIKYVHNYESYNKGMEFIENCVVVDKRFLLANKLLFYFNLIRINSPYKGDFVQKINVDSMILFVRSLRLIDSKKKQILLFLLIYLPAIRPFMYRLLSK